MNFVKVAIVFVLASVQGRVCGDQARYKKCYLDEQGHANVVCSTRPPVAVYFKTQGTHQCALHCNRYNYQHVHNADNDDAIKQKIFSTVNANDTVEEVIDLTTQVKYTYDKQLDVYEFEQGHFKASVRPWIDYSQLALNVKCVAFNYEERSKTCLLFDVASDYEPSFDSLSISSFYESVLFSYLYTNIPENDWEFQADMPASFSCSFHQVGGFLQNKLHSYNSNSTSVIATPMYYCKC